MYSTLTASLPLLAVAPLIAMSYDHLLQSIPVAQYIRPSIRRNWNTEVTEHAQNTYDTPGPPAPSRAMVQFKRGGTHGSVGHHCLTKWATIEGMDMDSDTIERPA
ncbi:hypothetical protein J3A83DRAFT_4247208 [Scleroderma citrinum]